eukprot:117011_1
MAEMSHSEPWNGKIITLDEMKLMNQFQIYVETRRGKPIILDGEPDATIETIKAQIQEKEGFPSKEQIIYFAGKQLENHQTLRYYNIKAESTIHLAVRMYGGCFVNGTKILSSNMKQINIEDIVAGNHVLTYDLYSNQLKTHSVKTVLPRMVNSLIKITFSNKTSITCTPCHPFYAANKRNWCCVQSLPPHNNDSFGKLCVDDTVMDYNGQLIQIQKIEFHHDDNNVIVRTLHIDGFTHNFFANNILVHNRSGGGMSQKGPNVEKKYKKSTGKNDLHFWKVYSGINYAGICENKHCKAHGERVMCARRYDSDGFNPLNEQFEEIPKCPGCKKVFNINSYYLYQCDCIINFCRKESKNKKVKTRKYKQRGNKVLVLGKFGDNDLAPFAEYQYLKFWVYKQGTL